MQQYSVGAIGNHPLSLPSSHRTQAEAKLLGKFYLGKPELAPERFYVGDRRIVYPPRATQVGGGHFWSVRIQGNLPGDLTLGCTAQSLIVETTFTDLPDRTPDDSHCVPSGWHGAPK